MDIIDKIFDLIKQNGTTASAVSKSTGIHQATFSQWKKRLQMPSSEKISLIADYFNVSTDYLLGTETKKSPPQLSDEDMELFKTLKSLSSDDFNTIKKLANSLSKKSKS